MLTTPNLEKYRQGDFVQYMNNVREIFDNTRVSSFNVAPQFNAFFQVLQELNNTWQPKAGSEITPEIVELDKQRDIAFNGFKMTVDAWANNHYLEQMRYAARVVADTIASHGGSTIYRMRYQQQTATLNAVIRDLIGPLSGHLNTLGLMSWVNHLSDVNGRFNTRYMYRLTTVARAQTENVEELIAKLIPAFRQLKALTEARITTAEADGTTAQLQPGSFIKEFNLLTQTYNDSVNRYTGKGEELPEDEMPTDSAEPAVPAE